MADKNDPDGPHHRWARLRFSIVGPLLASPPKRGELKGELERLAQKKWVHPITGEATTFGESTIERWLYQARRTHDPIAVLRRKTRSDSGGHPSISSELRQAIFVQYENHKSWSYQLHADNIHALVELRPGELIAASVSPPSYPSIRRFMKKHGLLKQKRQRRRKQRPGEVEAELEFESHEVRSYEMEHVNSLWHGDFHAGSRDVLTPRGTWEQPHICGLLDDHSRLSPHLQWYMDENSEYETHSLQQGFQKRGLPRAMLQDNGGAQTAAEVLNGLESLSVTADNTLPYSPHQNGKQEYFWTQIEGRLIPMLEGVDDLTLPLLNRCTQAWVEREYNRAYHSEIGMSPLERYLAGKDVGRPCPSSEVLHQKFTRKEYRRQRRSDGSISLESVRFEIPDRYRGLEQICVRYAKWDLSRVYLVDDHNDTILCRIYPVDKAKNSDGRRRVRSLAPTTTTDEPKPSGMAPLMRKLLAEYSATGLPPAYIPKDEE